MELLRFDEDELSDRMIEYIERYFGKDEEISEEYIIDYCLEIIDDWNGDNMLLSILFEATINKLEKMNRKVVE